MSPNDLPLDETTRILKYHMVTKGQQTIVNIEGCTSAVVIVNPADGRKPYIYYKAGEVDEFANLENDPD